MIDNFWGIMATGLLLGTPAGISPGPMFVLIISETLRHGLRAGSKVACIPLLTDAPLVLVSGFLFVQVSNVDFVLGVISLTGATFLLYLGVRSIRVAAAEIPESTPPPLSLKELMLANFVNPNAYLFWFTVGAPLMIRSFEQTWTLGTGFLFSFYLGLVGMKLLLAVVVGQSRDFLQGVWYRRIMQFLGLALIGFAAFLMRDGLSFFS